MRWRRRSPAPAEAAASRPLGKFSGWGRRLVPGRRTGTLFVPFNDNATDWSRSVVALSPDEEITVGKRRGSASTGTAAEVAGRRAVLAGIGVVGAGTLAACSSGSSASSTPSNGAVTSAAAEGSAPAPSSAMASSAPATAGSAAATSSAAESSAATSPAASPTGSAKAATSAAAPAGFSVAESEIPVGSGKYFSAVAVIVTQPAAGSFRAFSSVCTHQGCPVTQFSGALMICPCHGSEYSIKDGSVVKGPAPQPLAAKKFTVAGGKVVVAT